MTFRKTVYYKDSYGLQRQVVQIDLTGLDDGVDGGKDDKKPIAASSTTHDGVSLVAEGKK